VYSSQVNPLENHVLDEPPECGSYLEVLIPCSECMERGIDPTKENTHFHAPGITRMKEIACEYCKGTGKVVRYLSEDALIDYIIVRLAGKIPDILSKMKEEVVRDVMES
jgi:hypothetical protein